MYPVWVYPVQIMASAAAWMSGLRIDISRDRQTGYTKTGYMEEAKTRI
jgi:hypothetical protein